MGKYGVGKLLNDPDFNLRQRSYLATTDMDVFLRDLKIKRKLIYKYINNKSWREKNLTLARIEKIFEGGMETSVISTKKKPIWNVRRPFP